ncbi:MAG TPA: coproporphyrinogen III oxidase, partial [Candidatus Saccharimonadia bacterium]|nr:coproporphyrinogen III oxidase [Candidatus Saccharimonadia bacterium]
MHVPFCVSLCPYCDFVVYTGRATRGPQARVELFVRAIHVELDLRAEAINMDVGRPGAAGRPALDSVYLGGGTPS